MQERNIASTGRHQGVSSIDSQRGAYKDQIVNVEIRPAAKGQKFDVESIRDKKENF